MMDLFGVAITGRVARFYRHTVVLQVVGRLSDFAVVSQAMGLRGVPPGQPLARYVGGAGNSVVVVSVAALVLGYQILGCLAVEKFKRLGELSAGLKCCNKGDL